VPRSRLSELKLHNNYHCLSLIKEAKSADPGKSSRRKQSNRSNTRSQMLQGDVSSVITVAIAKDTTMMMTLTIRTGSSALSAVCGSIWHVQESMEKLILTCVCGMFILDFHESHIKVDIRCSTILICYFVHMNYSILHCVIPSHKNL